MGGRGSASGGKTGGSGGAGGSVGSGSDLQNMNTKFTSKQISSMNRSQLETAAKAVYIKVNMARGLSAAESMYRAASLLGGNSDAQLRRYIKRYG